MEIKTEKKKELVNICNWTGQLTGHRRTWELSRVWVEDEINIKKGQIRKTAEMRKVKPNGNGYEDKAKRESREIFWAASSDGWRFIRQKDHKLTQRKTLQGKK